MDRPNFLRRRERTQELSPVEETLQQVYRLLYHDGFMQPDDLLERLYSYVSFARDCKLHSQEVLDSCSDLAYARSTDPMCEVLRQTKQEAWDERRTGALGVPREPRIIDMHLYPIYFAAILRQIKFYEGRAYNPNSDKNYADIRQGDTVRFTLDQDKPEFAAQAIELGLPANATMTCTAEDVLFAPNVHGVYSMSGVLGEHFQPMLTGGSELLELQRVAAYYAFPGYPELIRKHGFVGIELSDPQLV